MCILAAEHESGGLIDMSKFETFALSVAAVILMTAPAHAYIDPATGAAVASAIMGFFATIYYTLRKRFYRLMSVFKRKQLSEDDSPS
jgi:O-antigen/teichoic acid export membrane protein